jgi:hypothetical protein
MAAHYMLRQATNISIGEAAQLPVSMPQSTAIIFMFISDDVVLLLCLHASPHA